MYKTILVPVDGSEVSSFAADEAVKLAGTLGSTVTFLYVVDVAILSIPDAEAGLANTDIIKQGFLVQAQAVLEKLKAEAGDVQAEGMIREGDVHNEIVTVADEIDAELIVMGTHGRRGINRLLLGSVAESVARRAHCAVLLVRPKQT